MYTTHEKEVYSEILIMTSTDFIDLPFGILGNLDILTRFELMSVSFPES